MAYSKIYNSEIHNFVIIDHPKSPKANMTREGWWNDEAWEGAFEIVHHTREYVWVLLNYCAEGHSEVKRVGDARNNGYDEYGNCVLSVPVAWCRYLSSDDAEAMARELDPEADTYCLWMGPNK
jgi:hypothetical protein